jgi:hypothetical protein
MRQTLTELVLLLDLHNYSQSNRTLFFVFQSLVAFAQIDVLLNKNRSETASRTRRRRYERSTATVDIPAPSFVPNIGCHPERGDAVEWGSRSRS